MGFWRDRPGGHPTPPARAGWSSGGRRRLPEDRPDPRPRRLPEDRPDPRPRRSPEDRPDIGTRRWPEDRPDPRSRRWAEDRPDPGPRPRRPAEWDATAHRWRPAADPGGRPPAPDERTTRTIPGGERSTRPDRDGPTAGPPPPRKLTVTRVAAWRGRQLTGQGVRAFRRAAGADGADRSGLTALTYASMMDYACDAALSVALANTLFFSAATAESRSKVALYLLITVAPFALVAPVIGPLLDRLQRGRRMALAASFAGRGALAVVMAFHFDDWGLYPAALGVLVLSKSFTVLRAAVTPRVLPEAITLVTTNSRLTVFGLLSAAVFGATAAGCARLTGSPGALVFTAALAALGVWLCLRIPAWVEVTDGEVPASLRGHRRPATRVPDPGRTQVPHTRQPMGRRVVVSLWANAAVRVLTGFLMLFVAFVVKAQTEQDPRRQVILLGLVGATAGAGSVLGNVVGARQRFDRSDAVVFGCVGAGVLGAAAVALLPGVPVAAGCALVAATASALAKVCLDAVIQRDLPERSRASAFGRSETILQLAWVFGGALGVLLPAVYRIGFTSVAAVMALVGAQAVLVSRGGSLLPWIRYRDQPVPRSGVSR